MATESFIAGKDVSRESSIVTSSSVIGAGTSRRAGGLSWWSGLSRRPARQSCGSMAMEANMPTMGRLFEQLGLSGEAVSIRCFIAEHSPMGEGVALCDAPFWTAAQAGFLREELLDDASWVGVIDRLNVALHETHDAVAA
jgi:hypothetical protein